MILALIIVSVLLLAAGVWLRNVWLAGAGAGVLLILLVLVLLGLGGKTITL